jgi:hypothetical protein
MKTFRKTILWKKSYLWVTLMFFLGSFTLHWIFGWKAFAQEELEKGKAPEVKTYVTEMTRDTMENWQSEFLQLMWQVCGLALFIYVGSPESKESDERKEEKIDHILRKLDPENYERLMKQWEERYPKK